MTSNLPPEETNPFKALFNAMAEQSQTNPRRELQERIASLACRLFVEHYCHEFAGEGSTSYSDQVVEAYKAASIFVHLSDAKFDAIDAAWEAKKNAACIPGQ